MVLLADFLADVGTGLGTSWRGILFRREYDDLSTILVRSREMILPCWPEARFLASSADYKWKWPTGEELLLRAEKDERGYWSYHGQEYCWQGYDELQTWPNLKFYDAMDSCCRSADPQVRLRRRATANPYGAGHNAVKRRFIDPTPPGIPIEDEMGRTRVRIRSFLWENQALVSADPNYLTRLLADRNPQRRRAWAYGDWNVTAGGALDDLWLEEVHVVRPFPIPASWYVDRGFDWGSAKPFSVLWFAESDGTDVAWPDGRRMTTIPGDLFVIAEWYGSTGEPNEGLRLTDSAIAKGIVEREKALGLAERVKPGPADTQIFDVNARGESIAGEMQREGVKWRPAAKGPHSRQQGLESVRRRLEAALAKERRESPGLFVFETCRPLIGLLPTLPRSPSNPEDVDTNAEDHNFDCLKMRCNTPRPILRVLKLVGT